MALFIHVYRTLEILQHMYLNLNYVQNVIQSIIPIISFQVITSPNLDSLQTLSNSGTHSIMLHHLGVAVDPRSEGANASVDTGVVGLGTSLTPRDNTDNGLGRINDGTTAVTLASIATTLGVASTEHVVSDGRSAIAGSAAGARDNGNGNLEQVDGGGGAALRSSSPASNGELSAGSRVRTGSSKATVGDGATGRDGGGQLQEGNIVVEGGTTERRVHSDAGDARSNSTRSARLEGTC